MLDKCLFIAYSTSNYQKLTNMWIDSLKNLGISDNNIKHLIETPDINLLKNTGFQSDLWHLCVKNKIKHLIDTLKEYNNLYSHIKYFIFTDCDIIYFKENKHYWNNLKEYIDNSNKDIFFMRNGTHEILNSGFFIIKNNNNLKNIITFFTDVVDIMNKKKKNQLPFGDQTVINENKKQIMYDYIPNDYVVFGTTIFNKSKSLMHHATSCRDVDDKIKQINLIFSNLGFN